jgi:hypothetical protein
MTTRSSRPRRRTNSGHSLMERRKRSAVQTRRGSPRRALSSLGGVGNCGRNRALEACMSETRKLARWTRPSRMWPKPFASIRASPSNGIESMPRTFRTAPKACARRGSRRSERPAPESGRGANRWQALICVVGSQSIGRNFRFRSKRVQPIAKNATPFISGLR